MEKIYVGKTKNVYKLENGNYCLEFKDDVTGEDGVFDPGANQVGLQIEGIGKEDLKLSQFFFSKIKEKGYLTHFVGADIDKNLMEVLPAKVFGKGMEIICRFRAVGSFIKRYGDYIEEGAALDGYVEVTLKDDDRLDPLITKEALAALNILSEEEYDILTKRTLEISTVIRDEIKKKGMDLYDIKLEFGRLVSNNEIILIDEIAGGNMRVYNNNEYVSPMDLSKKMLEA